MKQWLSTVNRTVLTIGAFVWIAATSLAGQRVTAFTPQASVRAAPAVSAPAVSMRAPASGPLRRPEWRQVQPNLSSLNSSSSSSDSHTITVSTLVLVLAVVVILLLVLR